MTIITRTHQAMAFPGLLLLLRRKDDLNVAHWNVRTPQNVGNSESIMWTFLVFRKSEYSTRCFFRHLQVRWIVQESPIYHHVEGSFLFQNPLSVNSAKFSFSALLLNSFQSLKTGVSEFGNELLTKLLYRVQLQL